MSQPTLRDYNSPSAVFHKWYLGPSRSWHDAKGDEPHHQVEDRSQNNNSASAGYATKNPHEQVPYEQVPLNVGNANSIRLVEILPNTSDDSTVSCMLHSASTEYDYIALSYMWGGEEDQEMITLNGTKILVRRNLWNFLRQKEMDQRENSTQLFWIDALCINQAGLAERNQQVAMMGKIYRQASSVLVWLGSETRTMELFRDMNDKNGKMDNDTYDEWMAAFRRGERSDRHLFYHEYWTRAWILQECVLASLLKLQCGPHVVHERQLYHLDAFRQSSWKYAATEMSPCRMVLQARAEWHNPVNRTYMQPFGNWDHLPQCSDPRDRIYSKLALMSPSIAIAPDYSKPSAALFREVAEKYIAWDTKCYSRLQSLAVTLDLAPDDWSDSGFLQAADPGIREIILRAELIWDYVASGETEEDFFERNWNEYVKVVLPGETREWLQTTRAGRELPNVLRDCLHGRCTIGAGASEEETPLSAAQCFEYDTLAEMGTRKQKLEAEMAPHGLGVKLIAEEK